MELTEDDFISQLDRAVIDKNLKIMNNQLAVFDSYCFKETPVEPFPGKLFDKLLELMKDDNFRKLPETSALIFIFEREWGKLDQDQKLRLLKNISETYGKFNDDVTHFILAEILGEYYSNDESEAILNSLSANDNDNARAFIAMAYRKLFKYQKNPNEDSIIRKLQKMIKDRSPAVRQEAEISLNKIQSKNK